MNPTTLLSRAVTSLRGAQSRSPAGSVPLTEEEALALAQVLEAELRPVETPALDLRGLPLMQPGKASSEAPSK